MIKTDLIIKKCMSKYYDTKHTKNLNCNNLSGMCYWQYAISGAGKIDHCFCSMYEGLQLNKPKVVRAMISE